MFRVSLFHPPVCMCMLVVDLNYEQSLCFDVVYFCNYYMIYLCYKKLIHNNYFSSLMELLPTAKVPCWRFKMKHFFWQCAGAKGLAALNIGRLGQYCHGCVSTLVWSLGVLM